MVLDPTNEIKAIRHRLGAKLDFDLDRIFADIQKRQHESGRTYIRLPRRQPNLILPKTSADGQELP
jgi:hypothetical protein